MAVADGQQLIGSVIDLQGRVVQAKALAQHLFQVTAHPVAVSRAADQDALLAAGVADAVLICATSVSALLSYSKGMILV